MTVAGGKARHDPSQAADGNWCEPRRGRRPVTELAVCIQAPSPRGPVVPEGERVSGARYDGGHGASEAADLRLSELRLDGGAGL